MAYIVMAYRVTLRDVCEQKKKVVAMGFLYDLRLQHNNTQPLPHFLLTAEPWQQPTGAADFAIGRQVRHRSRTIYAITA